MLQVSWFVLYCIFVQCFIYPSSGRTLTFPCTGYCEQYSRCPFNTLASFPLHIYPVMELLHQMAVLLAVFWRTSKLFSTMTVLIYIPTYKGQGLPFLHLLASTCYLLCFDNTPSNWSEVMALGGFWCAFPMVLSEEVELSPCVWWNLVICNNMVGTGGDYVMWNKLRTERQAHHDFTYIWNLKVSSHRSWEYHF